MRDCACHCCAEDTRSSERMRTGGTEVVTRYGVRRRDATPLAQRCAGPVSGGTAGAWPPPVPHRPWPGDEAAQG
jgi:hypothetical protein